MKQSINILAFLLIASLSLFAEDMLEVKASFSTGLDLGLGYEYVFEKTENNKKDYKTLSRLDWPILPSAVFNINAEIISPHGFHVFGSININVPSNTGKMEDRDYQNSDNPQMLTDFSQSNCKLKEGLKCNIFIAWLFPLTKNTSPNKTKIYIEPILGFRYYSHKWLASDGFYQSKYTDGGVKPDTKKTKLYGNGAEYHQKLYLPNFGIAFKFNFPQNWELKNTIQVCPNLLAHCVDQHFKRNIIFNDFFLLKGFSFHLDLSIEKAINKFFLIFFAGDFSAIRSYNGYTVRTEYGKITGKSISGTALYLSTYKIGVSFRYKRNNSL